MDKELGKTLLITGLAGVFAVSFFRRRKAASRCRRSTHDLLRTRGLSTVEALDKAENYCGTGGDTLASEVP